MRVLTPVLTWSCWVKAALLVSWLSDHARCKYFGGIWQIALALQSATQMGANVLADCHPEVFGIEYIFIVFSFWIACNQLEVFFLDTVSFLFLGVGHLTLQKRVEVVRLENWLFQFDGWLFADGQRLDNASYEDRRIRLGSSNRICEHVKQDLLVSLEVAAYSAVVLAYFQQDLHIFHVIHLRNFDNFMGCLLEVE